MNYRVFGTLVLGCYVGLSIFALGAALHHSHRFEGLRQPRQEVRR